MTLTKIINPIQGGGGGGVLFVKFYSGDDDMHLKAISRKLLPWQPEVEKSIFQFLLLDNYLKIKALIR